MSSSNPHAEPSAHRHRKLAIAAEMFAGIALVATLASADGDRTFRVKWLQPVSGPSPFAAGCPGARGDEAKPAGVVIEPAIAVNPADPRNLIATWKQDVSAEWNGRDDLVAASRDGGRTWRRGTIPGLTRCSGGTGDTASDPWVSFGGDGLAYFAGQAGSLSADPPPIANVASRSRDGGRRFGEPVTVAAARGGNEQPAITASPTRPGHAYLVWANFLKVIPAPFPYSVQSSRTLDGGATWEAPVLVSDPGPFGIDQAPRIFFARIAPGEGPGDDDDE
jgi:hypothetical protein